MAAAGSSGAAQAAGSVGDTGAASETGAGGAGGAAEPGAGETGSEPGAGEAGVTGPGAASAGPGLSGAGAGAATLSEVGAGAGWVGTETVKGKSSADSGTAWGIRAKFGAGAPNGGSSEDSGVGASAEVDPGMGLAIAEVKGVIARPVARAVAIRNVAVGADIDDGIQAVEGRAGPPK